MILYVQIDETTNQVIGYSSNKMHDEDVKIDTNDVEDRFLSAPVFYNYVNGELVYDEERYDLYIKRKQEYLTTEQKLGQKCSDLEIQLLMLQQTILMGK